VSRKSFKNLTQRLAVPSFDGKLRSRTEPLAPTGPYGSPARRRSDDESTAAPNPSPSPSPSATPSPTGCTQTNLASASPALSWNVLSSTAFTTTQDARVDITVDWQNANANVGAYVVQAGTCTQQRFNNRNCSFLLASGDDKPHVMSANLPAGSYELLLNDFGAGGGSRAGDSSETASVQIVQSTGCTASPNP
jgi:hypothetical protein